MFVSALTLLSVLSESLIWRDDHGIPSSFVPLVIVVLDGRGTTFEPKIFLDSIDFLTGTIESYQFLLIFSPEHLSQK